DRPRRRAPGYEGGPLPWGSGPGQRLAQGLNVYIKGGVTMVVEVGAPVRGVTGDDQTLVIDVPSRADPQLTPNEPAEQLLSSSPWDASLVHPIHEGPDETRRRIRAGGETDVGHDPEQLSLRLFWVQQGGERPGVG